MTRSRILSRLDQDIVRKASGFQDFQLHRPEAAMRLPERRLSGTLQFRVHPHPVPPSPGAQEEPCLNALRRGPPGCGCCVFHSPLSPGCWFSQWRTEAHLFIVIRAERFAFNVSEVEHQALSESDNQGGFPGTVRDSDEMGPRTLLPNCVNLRNSSFEGFFFLSVWNRQLLPLQTLENSMSCNSKTHAHNKH